MILNNAPQAEAVLSNVGEIGEFRIRNSAKAFNILSSGLYANKIRAIIRELSCNAVDSHVAAGKADTPFEVHIPTTLEPFFSIRDFGTGLTHEQVTNIYTTYFESTKTNSNAFIGALGLGSKSPFSYTDNFTVIAIKDGTKGIYSAFINGDGVPSIVKMGEEQTDEPAGVEIKFSVNERNDFYKFIDEARNVYRFFKLRPIVTGQTNFEFSNVEYETENIVPGVHSTDHGRSRAIMGNIAYPIEVPNTVKTLGDLAGLLECGLVMEFDIGELDFQASREGLSYIPSTIDAIKSKLEILNAALTKVLAEEADAIGNPWERSIYLYGKKKTRLWGAACAEYAADTKFELFDGRNSWASAHSLDVTTQSLAACNIELRAFNSQRGSKTMSNRKVSSRNISNNWNGPRETYWDFTVTSGNRFVINDTKVGASNRAKHHMRTEPERKWNENVYVLEPIDRTKPMMIESLRGMLKNPPNSMFMYASDLRMPDRVANAGMGKNVTILRLEERGGSRYRSYSSEMVWRDAGKADEFDDTKTHYYIPLSGFVPVFTKIQYGTPHDLSLLLSRTQHPQLNVNIHGVRKGDIDTIKKLKNWVNLEDHLESVLNSIGERVFVAGATGRLARHDIMSYNMSKLHVGITNDKSPALAVIQQFNNLPDASGFRFVEKLMEMMKMTPKVDVVALSIKLSNQLDAFDERYPLIKKLDGTASEDHVSEYINLIDEVKGV